MPIIVPSRYSPKASLRYQALDVFWVFFLICGIYQTLWFGERKDYINTSKIQETRSIWSTVAVREDQKVVLFDETLSLSSCSFSQRYARTYTTLEFLRVYKGQPLTIITALGTPGDSWQFARLKSTERLKQTAAPLVADLQWLLAARMAYTLRE
ncbi:hypothetical protein FB451DRAFT_1174573 [Mycena latifolia]|nr:hypothetical protein FB451DRAFT_1174573 [Mycena latifolia]